MTFIGKGAGVVVVVVGGAKRLNGNPGVVVGGTVGFIMTIGVSTFPRLLQLQ
jgi:hypothetical protein